MVIGPAGPVAAETSSTVATFASFAGGSPGTAAASALCFAIDASVAVAASAADATATAGATVVSDAVTSDAVAGVDDEFWPAFWRSLYSLMKDEQPRSCALHAHKHSCEQTGLCRAKAAR